MAALIQYSRRVRSQNHGSLVLAHKKSSPGTLLSSQALALPLAMQRLELCALLAGKMTAGELPEAFVLKGVELRQGFGKVRWQLLRLRRRMRHGIKEQGLDGTPRFLRLSPEVLIKGTGNLEGNGLCGHDIGSFPSRV